MTHVTLEKMEYYRDLNSDDFPTQKAYEAERIKRGLACGFTYRQIGLHRIIDLGLYLGMTQEQIVTQVGHDTGYIFPNQVQTCPPTSQ